ncbi:AAA family ATPase [uncultured Anaerococcus sp.]|uniref:AAA family ATPase n=1 Tax=uncultured Anaerococcus sp. TaxID=293428 RepID=UPI00288AD1C7|nr:AAA family ATPase [uncultured Anaerococcus sp.]
MRVRKVKLRGFLTYKDEIEIDFTRLFDKKIFLISGPTGSGKTTIFDAISFALYGEVPREIGMEDLRSDYLSEADDFTYVDLEFGLGKKTYKIIRVPSQRAVEIKNPKNIGHRVELYDITGEKILLADKLREADDKIKELVGLDKNQFSKVMLLAQGQFQKFLISKSDEKAALLSDIFKTDSLRAIQDELKKRANDNKKLLVQVDKDLGNILTDNELLEGKISQDLILRRDFENILKIISQSESDQDGFLKEILKSLAKLEKNEKNLISDLEKAKALNENIEKYKKAEEAYQTLLVDFDKNTQVKKNLDLISYALSIKIYEDRLEKTKADLRDFEENKLGIEKNLAEKKQTLAEIEKEVDKLPALKEKLDQAKIAYSKKVKEIADFEDFLEVKKSYESIKDLDKDLEKYQEALKSDEKDLEALRNLYDQKSKDLASLKEEDFANKEKISEIKTRLGNLDKDYQKIKENKAYEEKLLSLGKDLEEAEKLKARADEDREHLEINKLIDRLNTEGLCPVCGKSHQGHKEKLAVSDLDLEKISKDLGDLKIALARTKAIYEKNLKDLSTVSTLNEIEKIIADNKDLLESYEDMATKTKAKIKDATEAINEIGKRGVDLKKARDQKEKICEGLADKLKNLADLKIKYLAGEKAMAGLDRAKLFEEKKYLEDEIMSLDSFIKEKEKTHQDLSLAISKEKSTLASLIENIEKATYDLKNYQKDFEKKLYEKFENTEVYKTYLAREGEVKEKKELIETYFADLAREKTTRENFIDFKEKKPCDLGKFEENLREIEREIKILDEEKIKTSTKVDLIKKDGEKIKKIHEFYLTLSKTAQLISNLSDLANGVSAGVKGLEKLDFETFILSVYFDRVLNFANIRFNQMTDGQFSMVRKTEASDGRSKMGLDIEILDSNTGKKRPASTLSGGENFLASLSLALGLSDEIGAENGGIRIDTLFIDEGFGTLSKEFLANAIETIEKLSKENRFVGLISHVDDLKEAIEAKILITYDPSRGSSLEIVDD